MAEPLKIEGLKEFRRNLRKLDADLPKMQRVAFNDVANLVLAEARPRVPRRSGRAAGSLRAASTADRVRVKGGGARAPYYPWLDFGGRVGRRRSVKRTFYPDGRFLYAAYFELRGSAKFDEAIVKAIVDTAAAAGIVVS